MRSKCMIEAFYYYIFSTHNLFSISHPEWLGVISSLWVLHFIGKFSVQWLTNLVSQMPPFLIQ